MSGKVAITDVRQEAKQEEAEGDVGLTGHYKIEEERAEEKAKNSQGIGDGEHPRMKRSVYLKLVFLHA